MKKLTDYFEVDEDIDFQIGGLGTFKISDNTLLYKNIDDDFYIDSVASMNDIANKKITIISKNVVSEDAKVILRGIGREFKWIAADKNGDIWVYDEKPRKLAFTDCWDFGCSREQMHISPAYNKYFLDIISFDDAEPTLIDSLLVNHEKAEHNGCSHTDKYGAYTITYDNIHEMNDNKMHCEKCGKHGTRNELLSDSR